LSDWLQGRQDTDANVREESRPYVVRELRIFAEAMALIDGSLQLVLSAGPLTDEATQAKVIVANHGFNLLCSALDDALVGRYDSATSHWRSIREAPRFLMALQLDPNLSKKMMRGQLKIETALLTIEREFNVDKYPGADLRWVDAAQRELDHLQPFSHIHLRIASAGFPLQDTAGMRVQNVAPGGALAVDALLSNVLALVDAAIYLATSALFAFSPVHPAVQALGVDHGFESLARCRTEITEIAREQGYPD
jgi:hypothetical protein